MSHEATAWAIRQKGLKPAAKIVLWHLCDRYHPDHGCFPAQETLAADCEMSRSTLNEHLDALERAGLIRREQRREVGTFRQRSTLYRLAFEGESAGFPPAEEARRQPCETRESHESRVRNPDTEPCPENAESRVRNPDTNLVREPVREERESAGARAGGEQIPDGEAQNEAPDDGGRRMLSRLIRLWPGAASENLAQLRQRWAALPSDDRKAALDAAQRILDEARALGRRHPISLASYIAGRNWREIAEAEAAEQARPDRRVTFACWSRDWWALMIAKAQRGEPIAFPFAHAHQKGGQWGCAQGEFGPFTPELMRQHRATSEAGRAWLAWLERRAGKRIDIIHPESLWLFAPCEDPERLGEWLAKIGKADGSAAGETR